MSPLFARLVRYGRSRGQALGLAACAALFTRVGLPELPGAKPEGLAAMLAAASGAEVRAADVAWGPPGGALEELLFGRTLRFLGARRGEPRDLYWAAVRLTPRGQPISVLTVENVTRTDDADEAVLLRQGSRTVVATVRGEQVLAVTALESRRRGTARRTDLLVERPAQRAEVSLDARHLTVDLGEGAHRYDLAQRRFTADTKGALRVLSRDGAVAGGRLTIVDTARDLFGAKAVELGGRLLLFAKAIGGQVLTLASGGRKAEEARPVVHALLPRAAGGAPRDPLLLKSVVGAEGGPRDARVVLVRVDMRQAELRVQAGTRRPKASASVPGDGHLPTGAALRARVIAVLNAGDEGFPRFGAMADGRLLRPPTERLPSLRVTTGRELLLGPYPESEAVAPNVLDLLQWERPLLGGEVPPRPADGSVRRRSALCATDQGDLVYAFAESVDRASLSRALKANGCAAALPLAASPERLGFALARVSDPARPTFALLDDAMDFDAEATLRGSTRDFFYLLHRETTPEAPGLSFVPDGGTQPPPAWAPGIFAAETTMGGLAVRLVSFERGHVDFRLRAGPREIGARGEAWAGAFAEADAARALATLELGHATAANRYGLVLGSSVPLPVKPAFATLVIGDATAPRILLPGEAVTLATGEQAVQLPLLADDRDVTQRARERGAARPRAALGVADGGRLVVAFATHDSSDPLAVALRDAGCRRVVELDRGSHHPAFLHRAGTPAPPRTDYDSTTLWALSREMRPPVVVGE